MKRQGIIKGQTIEFDHPLGLPDGQAVELDIRPLAGENGAAPADETVRERQRAAMREAAEIRNRLEKRWGGKVNVAVQYVREDRDR